MIYISFDIGLKNLAFCILRYENQILSVIDWGIIVLAESKKKIKAYGMRLFKAFKYTCLVAYVKFLRP